MYKLIASKSGRINVDFHYMFKGFEKFHEIMDLVTYPISGRYIVRVDSDEVAEIMKFVDSASQYEMFDTYIFAPAAAVEYVAQRRTDVALQENTKMIDVFRGLISKYGLLFGKGVVYTLYNSIAHEPAEMEEALGLLLQEYGRDAVITEQMVAKHFLVNKLVYPRDVLNAFIWHDRWRWSKLEKCVAVMGNAIVKGAIVNNLKSIIKEKNVFFTTGKCSKYIRSLDTELVMRLYCAFVTDARQFQDVYILFWLYERGLNVYDLLQQEEL